MEYVFRKAAADDLELLVDTRITVLRAANRLDDSTDMTEVRRASREYYRAALTDDSHVAYLVLDGDRVIGTGGVSFFRVMPTYRNPSGRKAYIMNMYTAPEYRRRGIALRTLKLLVDEVRKRGITAVSLEATAMGRGLYERFGFVPMRDEMELPCQ